MRCRTCAIKLNVGDYCYELFPKANTDGYNSWAVSFIAQMEMWNIKVSLTDHFPKQVCAECYNSFDLLQKFRSLCEESNDHFKDLEKALFDNIEDYCVEAVEEEYISELDIEPVNEDNEIEKLEDFSVSDCEVETEIVKEINNDLANISDELKSNELNETVDVYMATDTYENEITFLDYDDINDKTIELKDGDLNTNQDTSIQVSPIEDVGIESILEESNSNEISETNDEANSEENITGFDEKTNWEDHIEILPNKRTRVKPNPLICLMCLSDKSEDLLYNTIEEKNKHHTLMHENKKNPYKCLLCDSSFYSLAEAQSHFKNKHRRGKICPICAKFIKRVSLTHLQRHFKSSYTCNICGLVMQNSSKAQFDYHMKWHDPDKQYKCSYEGCEKSFVAINHLKTHISSHKGVGDFLCSECGKDFLTKAFLKAHDAEVHGAETHIKCNYCNQTFQNYIQKKHHLRLKHSNELKSTCEICNSTFPTEAGLHIHMRLSHNKTDSRVSKPPKEVNCSNRPYACAECDKNFKSISNLRTHQTMMHALRHKCDVCSKKFTLKTSLVAHMECHKIVEFPCDKCDCTYTTRKSLKLHKRLKHKEVMTLKCDFCGLKFEERSHLYAHMRKVHINEY
ncbi:zinc finger protein 226-like [Teleopsis dalmanni]|uniref:zinc finger protein 226-like n=1 Tax=Teleopsis dalmanni TaxID=139649 RepID=UPI0018CD8754|nr:zinc finger protein 226-like [Teleopsis dalmanni]